MTITTGAIRIPSWVVSVVMPIVIGGIAYVVGLGNINSKTEVKLDHLYEEVDRIHMDKASSDKVEGVEVTLNSIQGTIIRIEQKLDTHIANSRH